MPTPSLRSVRFLAAALLPLGVGGSIAIAPCSSLAAPTAANVPLGDVPPSGSKPVSEHVAAIERRETGAVVTSAEFDDELWEVKFRRDEETTKVYLDPRTGEEQRRRRADHDDAPPAGAKPLSEILRMQEQRDAAAVITEAEFDDDGYWEIDLRAPDGRKRTARIDPRTGEPIR